MFPFIVFGFLYFTVHSFSIYAVYFCTIYLLPNTVKQIFPFHIFQASAILFNPRFSFF